MRTTVTIDDHLLALAKERARERDLTLGQLVQRALQEHLLKEPPHARPELPVMRGGGGFRPGIDPSSNASLYAAMHEEEDEKRRAMFRS